MDPPELRIPQPIVEPTEMETEADPDWIAEIVARLEEDPGECWPAFEGLSELDDETRSVVIAALSEYAERPGVRDLLRLLDPTAGTIAVAEPDVTNVPGLRDASLGRIVRSVVTGVDGEGRGTIALSARVGARRYNAAFHCDVRRGIVDAVGEVEREHPSAGRLVVDAIERDDEYNVSDTHELALRLLEGCAALGGPEMPDHVRRWLDPILGHSSTRSSVPLLGPDLEDVTDVAMGRFADLVLDACPDWCDRAPLTVELAEEIVVREGHSEPDPIRDAGAYRYLFEHRLIGRVDLYARMLLWMAWVWHADGRGDLARAAFALAGQLSDEQYVAPSHPFTVALTTRSFLAVWSSLR